jgi:hypothetical protein
MGTTAADTRTGVPDEHATRTSDWSWLLRVLALVVVFAVIAWARSRQIDVPFKDPHGKLFRAKIQSTLELLLLVILADSFIRSFHRGATWRTPWQKFRERWTLQRSALILLALVAFYVVYLCYRKLKSWDVFIAPKDDMLLRWDRWLFFGHSPAVLLHDLLGQDLAARALTALYESFATLVTVALVAALALAPTARKAWVFVASAMWAWILGVGSYYLIPSLGPFHAAPEEFAGLTHTSIQTTQEAYVAQRAHLLAHPEAHDAFAQISAFASLHCALVFLIFLMARYYGLRKVSWLIAVFLVGTLLATVYLGWHFAVDDVAGLAIAWVAVQLGKLTVLGRARTTTVASSTP